MAKKRASPKKMEVAKASLDKMLEMLRPFMPDQDKPLPPAADNWTMADDAVRIRSDRTQVFDPIG